LTARRPANFLLLQREGSHPDRQCQLDPRLDPGAVHGRLCEHQARAHDPGVPILSTGAPDGKARWEHAFRFHPIVFEPLASDVCISQSDRHWVTGTIDNRRTICNRGKGADVLLPEE
jgi:hypothetical protein